MIQPSTATIREQDRISLSIYAETLRLARMQNDRRLAEDRHALFTYWKQSVTDVVLTIFVLLIVAAGVYLSYLQFRADSMPSISRRKRREAGESDTGAGPSPSRTDLKISKAGLEMSSSVIGLFILLASMFFFYLYIEKVYPVRVVPPPADASSSE